jgi:hypothetical protein
MGQSLVEYTLMLPVLLIMLSGLIEVGFMLNYYLDIIDAARDTARFAAYNDPIRSDLDGSPLYPNPNFYRRIQYEARLSLETSSDGRINWLLPDPYSIPCDLINGDVVISSFGVLGNLVDERFPRGAPRGQSMCDNYSSKYLYKKGDPIYQAASVDSGLVLVEIYYEYNQVLALPWITAFMPDPVTLYAYTFMPNTYVEPTPVP